MAIPTEPFYGCLCLETSDKHSLPLSDERQQKGFPLPEIHFNIWERGQKKEEAFLDIGLMLYPGDPAERIEIFLPWEFDASSIEDLSTRILGPNGVSAVFNEAWTSSAGVNSPGGFVTRNDGTVFTIVPYDYPQIGKRNHKNGFLHSIVFDVAKIAAMSTTASRNSRTTPDRMYVRVRVKNVPKSFYRVGINQGDAFGGGALYTTEIIDFRLNVRRGVPPAIESFLNGRFIEFSKVQLFLMKSRDQDIVFEDKLFRACRSLEDENFWAEYILPMNSPHAEVEQSRKHVQGSLGYQWRKTPDAGTLGVNEFGTLARFKSFRVNLKTASVFFALALLVGVIGNGAYDGLCWAGTKVYTWAKMPELDNEATPNKEAKP